MAGQIAQPSGHPWTRNPMPRYFGIAAGAFQAVLPVAQRRCDAKEGGESTPISLSAIRNRMVETHPAHIDGCARGRHRV